MRSETGPKLSWQVRPQRFRWVAPAEIRMGTYDMGGPELLALLASKMQKNATGDFESVDRR